MLKTHKRRISNEIILSNLNINFPTRIIKEICKSDQSRVFPSKSGKIYQWWVYTCNHRKKSKL
jgi:hypothetical protein